MFTVDDIQIFISSDFATLDLRIEYSKMLIQCFDSRHIFAVGLCRFCIKRKCSVLITNYERLQCENIIHCGTCFIRRLNSIHFCCESGNAHRKQHNKTNKTLNIFFIIKLLSLIVYGL